MEERTEEASPRKLQEAHDEGRIARSQELTTAVALLGGAGALTLLGPGLARSLATGMSAGLDAAATPPESLEGAVALIRLTVLHNLAALSVVVFAMAGVTLMVTASQARGVFSTKPLGPDWKRINPLTNARNIYGTRSLVELLKALLKLLLLGLVLRSVLERAWPDLLRLGQLPVQAFPGLVVPHAIRLCLSAGIAYLALAMADYAYQLWKHQSDLRMTRQEVKQEHKQNEGDPMVKARRRSMGRAMARRQMFADVPKADLVIVNPTHIAIALRYDPTIAPAPLVLAMGQRKVAERIKAIATASGVTMVENRPLARALLASAQVGTVIPADLYAAVAEVLAFVFRQRAGQLNYRRTGAVA